MKKLILMLLVCGVAQADPRIEVEDNFCHFQYDPVNGDNERFIGGCGGAVTVRNGSATGDATIYHPRMNIRSLPPEIRVAWKESGEFQLSSDESASTCVLVDTNDQEYRSDAWILTARPDVWPNWTTGVTFTIECADAVAQ